MTDIILITFTIDSAWELWAVLWSYMGLFILGYICGVKKGERDG